MKANVKPTLASGYTSQPQFFNVHEGVQYELFCGEIFFSVRVIETASMQFHGIWTYESGSTRELMSSYEKLARAATPHLDLLGKELRIEAKPAGGSISANTREGPFEAKFTSPISASWGIPPQDVVIHQPLLKVNIEFGGKTYDGIGYCKRYWYGKDIDYWSWRFISGPVQRNGETAYLWTAEAMFELQKYDYFKLATPDGKIQAAAKSDSHHRETEAWGLLNGVECYASVRSLGTWEWITRKNNTDTKIIQSFCELTFVEGDKIHKGHALQEIGAGTAR
jgi:hypothetical protein